MLSFAIVSEVSAAALDEAEPGESGLNVHPESHNSTGPLIPGERFDEVSNGPVDDSTDTPHSNNDQTSFVEVPHGTDENMNLYEQPYDEHNAHDMEGQNQTAQSDNHRPLGAGEKMNITPSFNFNKSDDLGSGMTVAPKFSDDEFGEVFSDVTSKLIGLDNLSVAFKNNKHNQIFVSPAFNGVLPPQAPDYIELNESFAFFKGGLDSFDMDLENKEILPNNHSISMSDIGLPEIDDAIPNGLDFHLEFKDFLPKFDKTRHFPLNNISIHNNMPKWDSIKPDFICDFDLNRSIEGNFTFKNDIERGMKL